MAEILHQLRLVVYPIIYKVLYIPGGCLGFFPSTVWVRIQYFVSPPSLAGIQKGQGKFSREVWNAKVDPSDEQMNNGWWGWFAPTRKDVVFWWEPSFAGMYAFCNKTISYNVYNIFSLFVCILYPVYIYVHWHKCHLSIAKWVFYTTLHLLISQFSSRKKSPREAGWDSRTEHFRVSGMKNLSEALCGFFLVVAWWDLIGDGIVYVYIILLDIFYSVLDSIILYVVTL